MKRVLFIGLAVGSAVGFGIAVGFGLGRKYRARTLEGASVALFGETTLKERSGHFTHADATAVFGAVNLDLRESQIEKTATIDALALFGGIEVLIPTSWRLALAGRPIFGGIEDKTTPADSLPTDAPLLNVNAKAIFGGVVVANEPGEASRRMAQGVVSD